MKDQTKTKEFVARSEGRFFSFFFLSSLTGHLYRSRHDELSSGAEALPALLCKTDT